MTLISPVPMRKQAKDEKRLGELYNECEYYVGTYGHAQSINSDRSSVD